MKPLCGKTIRGAISSAAIGGVANTIIELLRILQSSNNSCKTNKVDCLWRGLLTGIAIGLGIFILIFFFTAIRGIMRMCFPVACGHRRCIFTGRSSKTLRDILLSVDETIPTEEKIHEFKENALLYLNDIKTELEKEIPITTFRFIFAGSTVERYGIPFMLSHNHTNRARKALSSIDALNTDLDVMFCSVEDKACFSEEGNILIHPLIADDVGFTGYAKLTSLTPGFEGSCVSSKLIRYQADSAVGKARVLNLPESRCCWGRCEITPKIQVDSKGPAIKIKYLPLFEADITLCFHCSEWPTLSDWPSRQRYWPSLINAQRIMSLGCHLVAKPAPSDEDQTSWRFSFSLAEVELSKLVPDTARKCFLALKIILKDHIQPVASKIDSYHIKTIFFNTLEKLPVTFWVEDNLEECFLTLLAEVRDALLSRNCPHHWFSFLNLFSIDEFLLTIVAEKVQRIMMNPAPFILDDGCCCFSPCCSRVPQYNFIRRTSQQFLDEYDEVIISVDRDWNLRENHFETHPFQSPVSSSQLHEVPGDLEPCEETTTRHGVVSLSPMLSFSSSQISEVRSDQDRYQETMARPEELVVSLPRVLSIPSSQIPEVRSDPDPYQGTTVMPENLVVSLPPIHSTARRTRLFPDEPYIESFRDEIPLTVVLPPI